MGEHVLQLYPLPGHEVPLHGLYLSHRVHELGKSGSPFVYANFLSSLDGRIALEDSKHDLAYVPKHLTTANDFRLFLELQAQADCLITHGGYLRALVDARLGNILQVGITPESKDLAVWRKTQGLSDQPAIVIASASLDFTIPQSIQNHNQKCYIATGNATDPERVKYWKQKDYPVLVAGNGKLVEGKPLIGKLKDLGYKSICLIAGPQMLDCMVRDGQLMRLYQTITHQLLGGSDFHTILPGPELGEKGNLKLRSLYYDPDSPSGSGQWFAQFAKTH